MAKRADGGTGTALNQGDIYMVNMEPTVGREQQGHRPVLIISATAFNRATRLPIVAPITSGGAFARRIGFAVTLAETRTQGIVRCDQPRSLDIAERGGRFIEAVPQVILEDVLERIAAVFS